MERNRISSLQSHGKALEKACCLPGVFRDSGDTPANLLCELNGHLMPCTSCFYGKWVEDVCAGHLEYLSISLCAVLWAAARGLHACPGGCILRPACRRLVISPPALREARLRSE